MMWAVVKFRFEGVHCWPDAPDGVESFLRNPHRHEFHATVWVEQKHDDRDVEYLWLKRKLQEAAAAEDSDLGRTSCETMCRRIRDAVAKLAEPGRAIRVMVTEDGENGALLE